MSFGILALGLRGGGVWRKASIWRVIAQCFDFHASSTVEEISFYVSVLLDRVILITLCIMKGIDSS